MNIPPLSDNFVYQGLDSLNFDNFATAMFFITLIAFSISCVFLIQTFSVSLLKKQNKSIKDKLIVISQSIILFWIFTQIVCAILWIKSYNQMPVKTLSMILILSLPISLNYLYIKFSAFFINKNHDYMKNNYKNIMRLEMVINDTLLRIESDSEEKINKYDKLKNEINLLKVKKEELSTEINKNKVNNHNIDKIEDINIADFDDNEELI